MKQYQFSLHTALNVPFLSRIQFTGAHSHSNCATLASSKSVLVSCCHCNRIIIQTRIQPSCGGFPSTSATAKAARKQSPAPQFKAKGLRVYGAS